MFKTKSKFVKRFVSWLAVLAFILSTALITYGYKISDRIPTWAQVYSLFGLNLEEHQRISKYPFTVSAIDVGQGDSIFVTLREKGKPQFNILIDAGKPEYAENVIAYLKLYNVKKIDLMIGTHPHDDHIGGMPAIMDSFEVEKMLLPKLENEAQQELVSLAKSKGIAVEERIFTKTESIDIDNMNIQLLGPVYTSENINDMSIIARISYKKVSFLFTGDSEALEEYTLLGLESQGGTSLLKSDVLKVGHHGSKTSSTLGFLKAVNPKYAVISCGRNNEFGHPNEEVVNRLEDMHIKIYRTDSLGSIVIGTDGEKISIKNT